MLKTRIIPCLDVKDGRTVKGVNFVDLRDAGDPVELAKAYDAAGADELCFLDITASHEGRGTMLDVVTRTAEQCFMPLTVGGGVRTPDDMVTLLRAGADKVAINSAAVANPDVIAACATRVGRQCVVVAIDARKEGGGYTVYTHGGRNSAGVDAVDHASQSEALGAGEILLTSMDKDGTKSGFDIDMLKAITAAVNIPVIASGGAGSADDFAPAVLAGGASAVLAASIFHFGEVSLADARNALARAGAPVRKVQEERT
ncbi:MAG: imidazole glycerol phosphate synthase subunit HisF [Pseudomonadota bacterium]